MLLLLATALLLGLALTAVGLRGRRADDHPLCRRCRFDLTGRPDGAERRCPECGADLARPRATVVGHRQRRPTMLGTGACLAIPPSLILLAVAYGMVAHVDWRQHAPVWYLVREARSADSARRTPAWAELAARQTAGRLTPADRDRVADAALAAQADAANPWEPAWGDWLQSARAAGQLSDGRWQRYLKAATSGAFYLQLRPRIGRGEPVTGLICCRQPPRVGITGQMVWVDLRDIRLGWTGRPPARPSPYPATFELGSPAVNVTVPPEAVPTVLADGPQTVHATAQLRVGSLDARNSIVPVMTSTIDLPGTFILLPAGQSGLKMIADPSLAGAIRQSLRVTPPGRFRPGVGAVWVDSPPAGISFAVLLRAADGRETKIGSIVSPPMQHAGFVQEVAWPAALVGHPVDVVFRADPSVATQTNKVFQAWNGEIVFKDVH